MGGIGTDETPCPQIEMNPDSNATLKVQHIGRDFGVGELDNSAWREAFEVAITTYWSGETAPVGRQLSARLLWSATAFYVRFVAAQNEPLVVCETPQVSKKTIGLWDRDVCEIFVAPDRSEPNRYFEFEAAPTGEWIDIGMDITSQGRIIDWDYVSNMEAAAKIDTDRVITAIKIPWTAFGKGPKAGETWLGNLFRCVGNDPDRGYLAWRPTRTPKPSFHVPAAFGEFVFVE